MIQFRSICNLPLQNKYSTDCYVQVTHVWRMSLFLENADNPIVRTTGTDVTCLYIISPEGALRKFHLHTELWVESDASTARFTWYG